MAAPGFGRRITCAALLLTLCGPALAAKSIDLVKTDLKPLIRAGATSKLQFAVAVPHAISSVSAGKWSMNESSATWRYSVRIPTAVSMSFHATRIRLPASAVLRVASSVTTITYRGSDLRGTELWSRIQPGDTLDFTLTVPIIDRPEVLLEIKSFQAGYRSLGVGVKDHPFYRRLMVQAAASNSGCVQNYECSVTPSNTAAAQATVGLTVGNMYQCTGVLINDVPGDNTPYVLTARHCESGTLGGGNPGAASTITIYWNATTPCGQTLGSLYDPSVATQTGATTIVEQQDAWLVQLDFSPVASGAYFVGFDATGGSVQGGYTVHHALGFDKQLTEWFGQAASVEQNDVLTSDYLSQFWEVVNALGNIGPGASGSGLIDQNNHLVGSLTLGRTTGDASGYESCPVNPPTAPNGSNGAADFTSLAAVWNSVADTTTSTGSATLKTVLDPANSGATVVASAAAANITFNSSAYSVSTGSSIVLTWNVPNATQCTAVDGVAGDGWTGTLSGSGSMAITETLGGKVSYKLQCQLVGGHTIGAAVVVNWEGPAPYIYFYTFGIAWTGAPALLTWTSTVGPCSITGGSAALANLPSSGSAAVTQNSTGDVTYVLSCGSGNVVTQSVTVTYVTPSVLLQPNSTDRQQGQPLSMYWLTYADTCVTSGGAPNDSWNGIAFKVLGTDLTQFNENTAALLLGTYTYTLACTAGPNTVSQSVVVTIEDNPAYATLTIANPTTTYTATPADYVTINWISNLTDCAWNSNPTIGADMGTQVITHDPYFAQDTATIAPMGAGTYVLTVTCSSAGLPSTPVTSLPVTVTVLPPPAPTAQISSSASTLTTGQSYTVSWTSTNTQSCAETGAGDPTAQGNIWYAGGNAGTSGSITVYPLDPGQFTFGINCLSIDPNVAGVAAQTVVTVNQGSTSSGSSGGSSSSSSGSGSGSGSSSGSGSAGSGRSGGGAIRLTEIGFLSTLMVLRRRLQRKVPASRRPPWLRLRTVPTALNATMR